MKILKSVDVPVTKYIHADTSETSIKSVSSNDTVIDPASGELEHNSSDRNKYSVFISHSAGCYMNCNFCYLTIKDMEYRKLKEQQIINNIKDAILAEVEHNPSIKTKYIKLCWMGMGDAMIDAELVLNVTMTVLHWVLQNRYAAGLDGVDLSTVMPKIKNANWISTFRELDRLLGQFPLNPCNSVVVHKEKRSNMPDLYVARSRFRLFYSIHSGVQTTRDKMIPNAMPLHSAIQLLREYSNGNKYNVILHHMFIDDENDSTEEVDALINLLKDFALHKHELRILRYNTCKTLSDLTESDDFSSIILRLLDAHKFLKIQISTGKDVQSACGQFITNN